MEHRQSVTADKAFAEKRVPVGVLAIDQPTAGQYFLVNEGRTVAGPRNVLPPDGRQQTPPPT